VLNSRIFFTNLDCTSFWQYKISVNKTRLNVSTALTAIDSFCRDSTATVQLYRKHATM